MEAQQKRLIALVERPGAATEALRMFLATMGDMLVVPENASSTSLVLLHQLITSSGEYQKPSAKPRALSKAARKTNAIYCAKLTQKVLKTYCTGPRRSKDDDITAAMDLACAAIFIIMQFEDSVALGALVPENMLYQVAKTYIEPLECKRKAYLVLYSLKTQLQLHLDEDNTVSGIQPTIDDRSVEKMNPKMLSSLSELPRPSFSSTVQTARLASGYFITVMSFQCLCSQYKMAMDTATTELWQWMEHLEHLPGADLKIAASFRDRAFRLLWKQSVSIENVDDSVRARSIALSLMIQCPQYSVNYYCQQAYRVGVQVERKSGRSAGDSQRVIDFYCQVSTYLDASGQLSKSKELNVDYILWMDHFASVCESKGYYFDAIAILEYLECYLQSFASSVTVRALVRLSVACILLQVYSRSSTVTDMKSPLPYKSTLASSISTLDRHDRPSICLEKASQWMSSVGTLLSKVDRNEIATSLVQLVQTVGMRTCARVGTLLEYPVELQSRMMSSLHVSIQHVATCSSTLDASSLFHLQRLEIRLRRMHLVTALKQNASETAESFCSCIQQLQYLIQKTSVAKDSSTVVTDISSVCRETYNVATLDYNEKKFDRAIKFLSPVHALVGTVLNKLQDAKSKEQTSSYSKKIASFLAECYQQAKDPKEARRYATSALTFTGDTEQVKKSVDRYVTSLVHGWKKRGNGDLTDVEKEIKRGRDASVRSTSMFREAFVHSSKSIVADMQIQSQKAKKDRQKWTRLQCALDASLKLEASCDSLLIQDGKNDCSKCKSILRNALCRRRQALAMFYASYNAVECVEQLETIGKDLATALEDLSFNGPLMESVLNGWRVIIACERNQLLRYSNASDKSSTTVMTPIEDIRADVTLCLDLMQGLADRAYQEWPWAMTASGIAELLENLKHLVNLYDWPALGGRLDDLLIRVQMDAAEVDVWPAPTLSLTEQCAKDLDVDKCQTHCAGLSDLDRNLALAHAHAATATVENCQKVAVAADMLSAIKTQSSKSSSRERMMALGLREVHLHITLSNIMLHSGEFSAALQEGKTALAIAWKLTRKFAFAPAHCGRMERFRVPDVVRGSDLKASTEKPLIYCMGVEASSWSVLTAASFALQTVATSYEAMDEVKKASYYYLEAMELVGHLKGYLHPNPFVKFARLHVAAGHGREAQSALNMVHAWNESGSGHISLLDSTLGERIVRAECLVANRRTEEAQSLLLDLWSDLTSEDKVPFDKTHLYVQVCRLRAQVEAIEVPEASVETLQYHVKQLERALDTCRHPQVKALATCDLALLLLKINPTVDRIEVERVVSRLEDQYQLIMQIGQSPVKSRMCRALSDLYRHQSHVASGNDRSTLLRASAVLVSNSSSPTCCHDRTIDEASCKSTDVQAKVCSIEKKLRAVQDENTEVRKSLAAEYTKQMECLPMSWTVTSLITTLSEELVISRMQNDGKDPTLMSIPSSKWIELTKEVGDITQASRDTLNSHSQQDVAKWTADQKREWWRKRKALDVRLGRAVNEMEQVLGIWRGLLAPDDTPLEEKERVYAALDAIPLSSVVKDHLTVLVDAIGAPGLKLDDDDVPLALRCILKAEKSTLSHTERLQVLEVLRSVHKDGAQTSSSDSSTPSSFDDSQGLEEESEVPLSRQEARKMRVSELRDRLAAINADTSGLKKDLFERLLEKQSEKKEASKKRRRSPCSSSDDSDASNFTILVLDSRLQEFPFEAMDVLRRKGVSRMPSLELISRTIKRLSEISRRKVSYVLNPGDDLAQTQQRLAPVLESGRSSLKWSGVAGRVPTSAEVVRFLSQSDLFVYCGHGSGEKYVSRKVVEDIDGCSASLLVGCSSGRLESPGRFGATGPLLSYLKAQSPAVVAMLWDVTDKDIDMLSVDLIRSWVGVSEETTEDGRSEEALPTALARARKVCKLRLLNGHAAVCYGLPIHVTN